MQNTINKTQQKKLSKGTLKIKSRNCQLYARPTRLAELWMKLKNIKMISILTELWINWTQSSSAFLFEFKTNLQMKISVVKLPLICLLILKLELCVILKYLQNMLKLSLPSWIRSKMTNAMSIAQKTPAKRMTSRLKSFKRRQKKLKKRLIRQLYHREERWLHARPNLHLERKHLLKWSIALKKTDWNISEK